jgi:exoribonuclease R
MDFESKKKNVKINVRPGGVQIILSSDLYDYFEFDSYTMSAHGRGSKQIIKLGDKVKVKVISASKALAQVEFAYLKATKNK